MKVKDVMTGPVISIDENTAIESCAKIMQEHNIGAVPVISGDSLKGIVTDRDIVVRTLACSYDYKTQTVKDIMTASVQSIDVNANISEAVNIMGGDKVRRLPVTESGKVVGMVSLGDIAVNDECTFEASDALCEISIGCHKKH